MVISKIRKPIPTGTTFLLNGSGKHYATNRAPCSSSVEETHKSKNKTTKKPTTDLNQKDCFKFQDIHHRIKIEQKEQQNWENCLRCILNTSTKESIVFQNNFSCVNMAGKIFYQPEIKHMLKKKQNTLRLVTCWSSGDIAHSVLSLHLSTVCYLHL